MKRLFSILFIVFISSQLVFSQISTEKKELYHTAKEAFDAEDFQKALKLHLKYDSLYPGDFEISYRIGACYLNSEFEKTKAIGYIEKAIKENKNLLPSIAFKDLASIYFLAYRFDDAEKWYKEYLGLEPESKSEIDQILSSIEVARKLVKEPLEVNIENVGFPVNTGQNEITPYVSADESILYYQNKENKNFYIAYNQSDKWFKTVNIEIPNLNNYAFVSFAGISPSGDQIYIQLGDSNNTDIYYGDNFLTTISQIEPLNTHVNSPYKEESVSLTPDGNTLYFSSNRPGGYGGFDIYKCEKDENDQWAEAINLGPVINTDRDERYPFIHPSLSTLFFSSNGHETMGGFDIFEASFVNKQLGKVKNIGYPINTTYDDLCYTINAKGSSAYFSSTRNDNTKHFDIYKVQLKESIPLTLVKGRILAGTPPKPIPATIQIVDKVTRKPLKYIYNPNPKTGYYLLIFPPGKNYDMIVNAKGYNPYSINIYIPNQTYFYENFQEIQLSPIRVNSLGEVIGEEIKISNTFYDVYKHYNDSVASIDSSLIKNYDVLLNLIGELIATTDTLGLNKIHGYTTKIEDNSTKIDEIEDNKDYDKLFNLVEEAIEAIDSSGLKVLDENAIYRGSIQSRYFYDKNGNRDNLKPLVVASDTIFAIPILTEDIKQRNVDILQKNIAEYDSIENHKPLKQVTHTIISFEKNSVEIAKKYLDQLTELAELVAGNPNLYIEIIGYSSNLENSQIAVSRAIEVRSFLKHKRLALEKTKTSSTIGRKGKNNQKVELKIFESLSPIYKDGEFSQAVKIEEEKQQTNSLKFKQGGTPPANFRPGITYRIQIASGSNYLKSDDTFFKGEQVFYYKQGSLYKYIIGDFDSPKDAYKVRIELMNKGFKGVFVVKFNDGVRID